MRLLLIRHGQTVSNALSALDTAEPGEVLTQAGEEQAAALVERLAAERIDSLTVSNLRRTHQTAAPLARARALTARVDADLREISAGDLEMRNDPESIERYHGVTDAWARGDLDVRMPGGESGEEVIERFDRAIARIAEEPGEGAVAVAHGAIIRTWAGLRSRNVEASFATSHALLNTGMVALEGLAGAWTCVSWADGAPVEAVGGP